MNKKIVLISLVLVGLFFSMYGTIGASKLIEPLETCEDNDEDGFYGFDPVNCPTGTDCNDKDYTIYPGATEVVDNGIDNDCDGNELCYLDGDDDGYRPDSTSTIVSSDLDCIDSGEAQWSDPTGDCDDSNANVNPGESEVCDDGIDNDCDGFVDYLDSDCLENNPPVADPNGPYVYGIEPGVDLELDGSASYDPDEPMGDYIVSYEWDFNIDSFFDVYTTDPIYLLPWDGSEPNIIDTVCGGTCELGVPYTITLRVTDTHSESGSTDTTVTIYELGPNPVADPNGPYHARPDNSLELDASGSYHPDPDREIVSYEWDFNIDSFFDVYWETSVDSIPWDNPDPSAPDVLDWVCGGSCVYDVPYVITLRVTDDLGHTSEADAIVTVHEPIQVELLRPEDGGIIPTEIIQLELTSSPGVIGDYTWYYSLNYGPLEEFDPLSEPKIQADECGNVVRVFAEDSYGLYGWAESFFDVYIGDVTAPFGKLDIFDIVLCAGAYGSNPESPKWKPQCDIVPNNAIDIFDIVRMAGNYGKTFTVLCDKPHLKIIQPEDGIASGYNLVAATDLHDIPPERINSVEFQVDLGLGWEPINGIWGNGIPKDEDELFWENVWDTNGIAGGTYPFRIYVDSDVGVFTDEISIIVNEEPVPDMAVYFTESLDAVVFDGSASYDPEDGAVSGHEWFFSDIPGSFISPLVIHPIPTPPQWNYYNYSFTVEHVVMDTYGIRIEQHYIIIVRYSGLTGLPEVIDIIDKSCGCQRMEIKDTGASSANQWWMTPPNTRTLGGYSNVSDRAGNPSFQIVHNFEVIAYLHPHSDPSDCTEWQRVKRTAGRGGNTYNKNGPKANDDGTTGANVNCPFGGADWCDDDYRNPSPAGSSSPTKFYIDQSEIRWLDGPGNDNVRRNDLPYTYDANFEAKVQGPLGWCKCTWDVRINTATPKNAIENVVCTAG